MSKLDFALDLMARLPPAHIEENLEIKEGLIDVAPELAEDLLSTVDQPLKLAFDSMSQREYLLCDYNRDGDSYRSPWSNTYDPPLEDGLLPSAKLRSLEVELNAAFDIYKELYYEGGNSSVYCWDMSEGRFGAAILIKKTQEFARGLSMRGVWDSVHLFEVQENNNNVKYRLTSTIMLFIDTSWDQTSSVSLAGNVNNQLEKDTIRTQGSTHIVHMGRMVEDVEIKMRMRLDEAYFGKTREINDTLRNTARQGEGRVVGNWKSDRKGTPRLICEGYEMVMSTDLSCFLPYNTNV